MHSDHEHHTQEQKPPEEKNWWFTLSGFITFIFIVLVGYYLVSEHSAHISQFLSGGGFLLLILLLCPLMHLFMHGGHGGHGGHHSHHQKKNDNKTPDKKD